MKKIIHILLYISLICIGTFQSKAQSQEGGGGFIIDGIEYEIINFNPNEVDIFNASVSGDVEIPSTVTFQDVSYTVTAIASNAFSDNTELTGITIPATVQNIRGTAFANTGITEVTMLGTVPPTLAFDAFDTRSTITLTVPVGTEDDYLSAGWTGFASINGTNLNFEENDITYSLNSLTGNTLAVTGFTGTGTNITIPSTETFNNITYTINEIAGGVFENKQLTSVTLPNTLIKIGSSAFKDNQLTSISIPNAVTELPERIFQNNQLTSVTLPNALSSISNDVFRDNQLTSIILPNTITTMGERAFFNNQLTSVTIPTNITIMEGSVFRNNNLSNLTIPPSVTEIGIFAFGGNNLTTITIPASVTSIGNFGFWNNPLTSVNALGTTPPVIGDPAFTFGFFETLGTIDLTVPTGTETAYQNAGWTGFASINGVVSLVEGVVFTENDFDYKILSLSPNEVEIVGGTNIPQDLIIPENVTTQNTDFAIVRVGQSAFENGNLTSIQLPNTLRFIDNFAFQNNQLTSLTIPTSVQVISFRAFRLNQIGGDLLIPNSVTSLGNGAFEVNNLTSVTISENISTIGNQTFRNNQLTTVTIPANVNSLGDNCFRSNPLAEVIVLNTTPPNILAGNDDSFLGIRGNIALTVPATTELEYLTNGWTGFASINGEDPAFFNEFVADNITYRIKTLNPNEVEIEEATVSGDLTIPGSITNDAQNFTVTSIATDAFRDNQLTSVIIPGSVASIGARAFRGNPLTNVIIEDFSPPTLNNQANGNNTFTNRSNIDVYVRVGNVQSYINAGWTGFKSITGVFKALLIKTYLQGPSLNPFTGEEDLMRDDLLRAGLLPFISPYQDGLTVSDTIYVIQTTGPDSIVDWIYLELRDRTDSTIIIEERSALLQRDGDIVDVDAITPVQFTASIDDYFVTIKHRNHLGIMTATPVALKSVANVVDFSNTNNPITFGSNAQTTAGMPSDTFGMWTGNVNGDNIVQYSGTNPDAPAILSLVLNDVGNFLNFSTFVVNGYNVSDLDLDGNIQYEGVSPDAPFILQNVLAHPGNFLNFSTFQILEQLP